MSTIDSYLLISGANISYDIYRPWSRRELADRQLLAYTRWGIVAAAVASVGLALFFSSILSAWVFMSSVLIAAALVPVSAALTLARPRRTAGLWSSVTGLTVVLACYGLVIAFGVDDPEWGTRIWSFTVGERTVAFWQEYAVLAALPASACAFVAGHMAERPNARPRDPQ